MNNSPCLGCKKRFIPCHDTCTDYKQFKEIQANVQAARSEFLKGKSIAVESARRCKR